MISIVCQVFSQKNLAQIPFLKLLASFLLINLASTIFLKPLSYFNSGTRDLFSFEISGQRASGFFLHPNALGIFAAAATVYGLSLKRVSVNWRWIIIISGSYLTYLSGSRTALLALILTIFFKLFLSTKLKKPFLFITLVLSGATMFGILDSLVDPGRRLIWSRIRFYFLDNISLLGQGPSVWSSLSEKGILITSSTFNAHNQWLEIYAIYGILGVILLFATMFRLILKAENSQLPMLLFFLIAFCTEVPFSLNVIDARLLLVPMFLMLPKTYPLSLLKRGKEE
jgi:O-antigen ligase